MASNSLRKMSRDRMNREVKHGADTFMHAVRERLIQNEYPHPDDYRQLVTRIAASMLARIKHNRAAQLDAEQIDPDTDENTDGSGES